VVRALRKPLVPALVVSIVVLVTGCVGGPNGRGGTGAPAARPTPTQASGTSNQPSVKVTALGDGDAATLQRAARAATPELQRFLARYVAVAFAPSKPVDPRGDLAALFDAPVRGRLQRDLAALSLGPGGERVSAVRLDPVTATAVLFARGGRPMASTVRLAVDGTAVSGDAETPISMRSTFQMLRGTAGWVIVSYDSQTKVPA
jgi:hypothetical protein